MAVFSSCWIREVNSKSLTSATLIINFLRASLYTKVFCLFIITSKLYVAYMDEREDQLSSRYGLCILGYSCVTKGYYK